MDLISLVSVKYGGELLSWPVNYYSVVLTRQTPQPSMIMSSVVV